MVTIPLTVRGAEKLKEELARLKGVERHAVIQAISEARAQGDLSENAEYDAAVHQQSMVEGRIEEIETLLRKAQIIEHPATNDKVRVGTKVEVEIEGDKEEFSIVGTAESDPAKGLISTDSPMGKALLNRKVGEIASVVIPDGATADYKIIAIS